VLLLMARLDASPTIAKAVEKAGVPVIVMVRPTSLDVAPLPHWMWADPPVADMA